MANSLSAPPDRRPVVLFRALSIGVLPAAILFRLLGRRVIFFEALGRLRSESGLRCAQRLGLELIDYHAYKGFRINCDLMVSCAYSSHLMEAFADPELCRDVFRRGLGLDNDGTTARAYLYNEIRRLLIPIDDCYALAEYFRDTGVPADVFHPPTKIEYLLSAYGATEVRNLHTNLAPISLAWQGVRSILGRIGRFVSPSKPAPEARATDSTDQPAWMVPDILYFPHRGISYGSLFRKDQYYAPERNSPFHASNIFHADLHWMWPDDVRAEIIEDGRRNGVEIHFISYLGASAKDKAATVWHWLTRRWRKPDHVSGALILAQLELRLKCYRRSMEPLASAKMALIDSESLFPPAAVLALQSWNIHVCAVQERFMSSYFNLSAPILDTYFVHGRFVAERLASKPFTAIHKIVTTGDPRVDLIQDLADEAKRERASRFGGFDRVCLVLDFHSVEDCHKNPLAHPCDWRSNTFFLEVIRDLAETSPNCAFIIRGKDCRWREISAMSAIRRDIDASPNVFVDADYTELNRTYKLAAMADVVIARYTSACDQCLAAGIPTLVFEGMPNGDDDIISNWHDYAPYPVLVRTADELRDRFRDIEEGRPFMVPDAFAKMRTDYYEVRGVGQRNRARLRAGLENTYRRLCDDVAKQELSSVES